MRKILVMGLPGAGKTTLASALAKRLNAVHFNADAVRANISRDLAFTEADRVEHARRTGWLCDRVTATGTCAVADLICPTPAARQAFSADAPAFIIWIARAANNQYPDTNALFVPPENADIIVTDGPPEYWAEKIAAMLQPEFDPQKPTALFIGRYQPFHGGHHAIIAEGIKRIGQACIAVRNTHGLNAENPFSFENVKARAENSLQIFRGRFVIIPMPNIAAVFYGRNVGYIIERLEVDEKIQTISATQQRTLIRA